MHGQSSMSGAISITTPILQALIPLVLFTLSGVALCLAAWVIPLIMLPSNTSRSRIHQFNETVVRGGAWLQPCSRIVALLLVVVTILTSQHPDTTVAAKWKYYLVAGLVVVQTAWWEIIFIFPINDEVKAMEANFASPRDTMLGEKDQKRLHELEIRWRQWHWGRIMLPFVSGCITLAALF